VGCELFSVCFYQESEVAMRRGIFAASLFFVLLLALIGCSLCQAVVVGDLAPNFTEYKYGTTTPISRADFAGKVAIFDFFAYWCGPCKNASLDIEPNIQQYYNGIGGNPAHIPVQVASFSIDGGSPSSTQAYINDCHLELVVDDSSQSVFSTYTTGYIPQFAIINGVAGARNNTTGNSIKQWEILELNTGYPGSAAFCATINQVDKPRWQGNLSGNWDIGSPSVPSQGTKNWRFVGNANTLAFYQGDEVLFDDNATGTTSVNIATTVTPVKITVDNSTKNYTFSGTGKISGTMGINKSGSKSLTILTNNNYTGATTIAGGTFELPTGGGISTASAIIVGSSLTGGSTLKISGGSASTSVNSGNSLYIGGTVSQPGMVNMSAGSLSTSGTAATETLGDFAPGTWTQSGGTANLAGNFWIGNNAAGTANLMFSNNAALTVGSAATDVFFGVRAAATMTIQNTATVTIPTLNFGSNGISNTNSRTVNLNGGTLAVKKIRLAGGTTGTFNFNGGTLKAGTSDTAFMTGLPNAFVMEGGAILDTNGNNITVGQALEHGGGAATDGGLTKNGNGKLTLTGALTYAGDTNVLAGTLEVGALTHSANVHVVDGILNASQIITNTLTISSTGHVAQESIYEAISDVSTAAAVPEPGTIVLLELALLVLAGMWFKGKIVQTQPTRS
jgi:autotransporter-associated beta strand protein